MTGTYVRAVRALADRGSVPGSLVLDGQRSATPSTRWCELGPDRLRYLVREGAGGRYVRPRCKRRDCPRCWSLRSRETARALLLDARREMPRHCLTLTTRTPWEDLNPEHFRRGMENVYRRLRRHVGRVDYFAAVEFTTGRAQSSGGRRRMHAHALLKLGADRDHDVVALAELVRETWHGSTGAWRVELAELRSPGAALGYLGLHHRKPSQAPPGPWRGMTERASRGYWSSPIAELRVQARRELAAESRAWATGTSRRKARAELDSLPTPELRELSTHYGAVLAEPREVWR